MYIATCKSLLPSTRTKLHFISSKIFHCADLISTDFYVHFSCILSLEACKKILFQASSQKLHIYMIYENE